MVLVVSGMYGREHWKRQRPISGTDGMGLEGGLSWNLRKKRERTQLYDCD